MFFKHIDPNIRLSLTTINMTFFLGWFFLCCVYFFLQLKSCVYVGVCDFDVSLVTVPSHIYHSVQHAECKLLFFYIDFVIIFKRYRKLYLSKCPGMF